MPYAVEVQPQTPFLDKTYDIKYTACWRFLVVLPFLVVVALVIALSAGGGLVVVIHAGPSWFIIVVVVSIVVVASSPRKVEKTSFGYVLRTFCCQKTLRFSQVADIAQIGMCQPVCYCGRTKGQLTDPSDGVLMKTDCCSYALIFSPACGSLQFIAENRPFIPAMSGQMTGAQYQYPAVTLYQQQPLPPQPMQPVGGYIQPFHPAPSATPPGPPGYFESSPAPPRYSTAATAAGPVQKF
ncbi:unnamed protein product [Vitrella brassicaformis CCMP3155]|uniref:Uncharacterized protein n=1 Tax=Vitrella brassicaformis (strain CCMP3155) TaxID=1169540 RepID=A0A0G4GMJ1_VITBC|nr:unnamed protein product [Vitrella brassicaformis CCMP3155]|eukprot:CEM31344.1 unnamed protein product [Vitrella brassicaformis CCMP3155]